MTIYWWQSVGIVDELRKQTSGAAYSSDDILVYISDHISVIMHQYISDHIHQ